MQADFSEACREARVGFVVNYPKSDFCNIFCNWESSRGPREKLSGPYDVQAWIKPNAGPTVKQKMLKQNLRKAVIYENKPRPASRGHS